MTGFSWRNMRPLWRWVIGTATSLIVVVVGALIVASLNLDEHGGVAGGLYWHNWLRTAAPLTPWLGWLLLVGCAGAWVWSRRRAAVQSRSKPIERVSDNVLWRFTGRIIGSTPQLGPPLCPADKTPLVISVEEIDRALAINDRAVRSWLIRGQEPDAKARAVLRCIECGSDYTFDTTKRVTQARERAQILMTGVLNRGS